MNLVYFINLTTVDLRDNYKDIYFNRWSI